MVLFGSLKRCLGFLVLVLPEEVITDVQLEPGWYSTVLGENAHLITLKYYLRNATKIHRQLLKAKCISGSDAA